MTWAAPWWLLGLAPWSAVVLYLLWGRRRRADVPFLDLWQVPAEGVRVRRRVSPPPVALALAILAMLLGVLAAARPEVRGPWGGSAVSIVIDRGYTMSARGATDDTRVGDALAALEKALRAGAPLRGAERSVVPGPGPESSDVADLRLPPARTPTAVDTRDALSAATRAALARTDGPVIVVSDQPHGFDDARVVRVPPAHPVRNARIVLLAAREGAPAQVMVRLRGGAGIGPTRVRVTSAGASAERDAELQTDADVDVFVDLPRLGDFVKAELLVTDDQPADDAAWLVRESSWPRLEPRAPLPPHVQRVVEVYARSRPPGEGSARVAVVRDARDLPAGEPGVVVANATSAAGSGRGPAAAPLDVRDHPVTRGVAWADVGSPALATDAPPPPAEGWAPVVSAGGKVWVAVREQPIRAVWVGVDAPEWARSADFVVFWADVFNWVGAGGERFASHPVGSLAADWRAVELAGSVAPPEPGLWPGLYRRADGTLRALHAPDVPFPTPPETNWQEQLARLTRDARGGFVLAPWLAVLALMSLLLAAWLWKAKRGHRAAQPDGRLP